MNFSPVSLLYQRVRHNGHAPLVGIAGLSPLLVLWFVGVPAQAQQGPLVVGEEFVLDPGIRSSDPDGSRTRFSFCQVGDRLTATWSSNSIYGTDTSQLIFLDEEAVSDGIMREVGHPDAGTRHGPIQVLPLDGEAWGLLLNDERDGLSFGRRERLRSGPVESILLDPGPVDDRFIHVAATERGLLFTWRGSEGEVRLARVSSAFVLEEETLLAPASAVATDLEFGDDGGVIAWCTDAGISYVLLDPAGAISSQTISVPVDAIGAGFAAARLGEVVVLLFLEPGPRPPSRLIAVDAATGAVRSSGPAGVHVERETQVASGPEGAIVVSDAGHILSLDAAGVPRSDEPIDLNIRQNGMNEGHDRWFDSTWTGSHFLVAASSLIIEVGPQAGRFEGMIDRPQGAPDAENESSLRYCYVSNLANGWIVEVTGAAGPPIALHETFQPSMLQPWFVRTALHLLLEDAISGDRAQMWITESGWSARVDFRRGNFDCQSSWRTRRGIASGSHLHTVRWLEWSDRWGDLVLTTTMVERWGRDGFVSEQRSHIVGSEFDVAVVGDQVWIVSDYHIGTGETRVWPVPGEALHLLLPPAEDPSRMVRLHGRPYVVWNDGPRVFGSFIPTVGADTLMGTLLHHGSDDLVLHDAVEGGLGGLILLTDTPPGTETGLFALPIGYGVPAAAPSRIATGRASSAQATWTGERFLVAWSGGAGADASSFRLARVGARGRVVDPGGRRVTSSQPHGPTPVAGADGNLAVVYGGNRVRFLHDDLTPIVTAGPDARIVTGGVELAWQPGDIEIARVAIERAAADEAEPRFVEIAQLSGSPTPASYTDTAVERGLTYLYLLRMTASDGEEWTLGPVGVGPVEWFDAGSAMVLRPNPVRTRLELSLDEGAPCERIEIVDVCGRIRGLTSGDGVVGRTENGRRVRDLSALVASLPAGVYWARIVGPDSAEARRFQIIR